MNKILIGSHVSMSKTSNYFLGAVETSLKNGANTLMIYTGPPQNTKRVDLKDMKIQEGLDLALKNNLNCQNFVIHAPYIINLATYKENMRQFGIKFLIEELQRAAAFKIPNVVLHPGSFVGQDFDSAMNLLADSLNQVLKATKNLDVSICLETMAGKGNEIGHKFEHLADLIKRCDFNPRLKICLDTCHIHDSGYNLKNKNDIINSFNKIIGLDRLAVIHINDSCNPIGAKKDRHANLGYGHIGFDVLLDWIYDPRLSHLPKILETPYFELSESESKSVSLPPYKYEIELIKEKIWTEKFPQKRKLVFEITSAKTI